jgi:hypothetical protein
VTYPTLEVAYRFRFPAGYAPDRVRIEVKDRLRGNQIDFAETERVRGELLFELNTVMINLSYVLPRYDYIVSWNPPGFPPRHDEPADRAREQVYSLCLHTQGAQADLCGRLRQLRDDICAMHLGCSSEDLEQLELGLYAFDELGTPQLKWIAGTHSASSPFREGTLPWGVGIPGWTMRRKHPLFMPIDDRSAIYRPFSGCPREKSVLSVPIPAPWDMVADRSIAEDPALPCVAVTLSSLNDMPKMRRMQIDGVFKAVSDAVLKSALDILMSMPLS